MLFVTQIISGVGFAIGSSVGALLAAEMAGVGLSGLAQSAAVVGAALLAVPATTIVRRYGRRPSLTMLYGIATAGALIIVASALLSSLPLLFTGFFIFGGASAAGYQARYAAVDLAPPALRGRHLSLIVWATTLGAVAGPNLAPVAGTSLAKYGVPTLAGPYVFSAALLALAAVLLFVLLRPDPIVVARHAESAGGNTRAHDADTHAKSGMRAALRVVISSPPARLGVVAMAVGHLVMIAIMAMTPVHIRAAGHDAAHTLRIVGVVISLHIAGMFAFSPVMGWLTDRFGRRPVISGGIVLLIVACALAGTAGHNHTLVGVALMVLGLGWSATMVAGSTLLTESVPNELRASSQGLSDLIMGLAGASAGALSGVIVFAWGYSTLALLAALMTAPLLVLTARFAPTIKSLRCLLLLLACAFSSADAQTRGAVQVPLETGTGWGPITPPAGYKSLRIQGRSTADVFLLARLFGDFAAHPSRFPRVVAGVDILACDTLSLKMRYRTIFDSKPGGKTMVESFSTVNVSMHEERVEFTWRSDTVKSAFVNAATGRAMFVARRTPNGTETLIDYVSAIRPKNSVKGVLVESQRSVLANDAKYVIDRLIAAAEQHKGDASAGPATANLFSCKTKQ